MKDRVRYSLPAWPSSHSCSCNISYCSGISAATSYITHVQGELVTPTGAAIAAAIRTRDTLPEQFIIKRMGMGGGKRDYGIAGILRAMWIQVPEENKNPESLGETGETREAPDDKERDQVMVLESNLDDCTGETLGFVMEELLQAGALDVWYQPIYMKKNRPAYKLSILCKIQDRKSDGKTGLCPYHSYRDQILPGKPL